MSPDFIDAADGSHSLLQRQDDLRYNLFRACSRQIDANIDCSGIRTRKKVEPQVHEAEYAHDNQKGDHHESKDRTLNADLRKSHGLDLQDSGKARMCNVKMILPRFEVTAPPTLP